MKNQHVDLSKKSDWVGHDDNRPTRLKQSSCLKLSTSRDNTQWVSAETNQKELELAYDWECYYTPVFSSFRRAHGSLAVVFGCFGVVCVCSCAYICIWKPVGIRWLPQLLSVTDPELIDSAWLASELLRSPFPPCQHWDHRCWLLHFACVWLMCWTPICRSSWLHRALYWLHHPLSPICALKETRRFVVLLVFSKKQSELTCRTH